MGTSGLSSAHCAAAETPQRHTPAPAPHGAGADHNHHEEAPVTLRSTTARGYGSAHQRTRERYRPLVESGQALCARCGEPIAPGALWELDHSDDRAEYIGPSHRTCNRRAGQANATAARMAKAATTVRDW